MNVTSKFNLRSINSFSSIIFKGPFIVIFSHFVNYELKINYLLVIPWLDRT